MRKAQWSGLTDMMGFVILALGVVIWLVFVSFSNNAIQARLDEKVEYLDNPEVITAILREKYEGRSLAELIIIGYVNQDENIGEVLQDSLDKYYGEAGPVCYRVYVDDAIFLKADCRDLLERPFLDSQIDIPGPHGDATIKIEGPGFR